MRQVNILKNRHEVVNVIFVLYTILLSLKSKTISDDFHCARRQEFQVSARRSRKRDKSELYCVHRCPCFGLAIMFLAHTGFEMCEYHVTHFSDELDLVFDLFARFRVLTRQSE